MLRAAESHGSGYRFVVSGAMRERALCSQKLWISFYWKEEEVVVTLNKKETRMPVTTELYAVAQVSWDSEVSC